MKILIIQTAFIGDVILATALIEKLIAQYPNSEIHFLVRKGNESLLTQHPHLAKLLVFDKSQGKYKNLIKLIKQMRAERFDYVINAQRFFTTGLITALSGGKRTIGFDKNPLSFLFSQKVIHVIGDGKHEVDRNQKLIEELTDSDAARPKLYPAETDIEKVKKYQGSKYLCLAPTSVWFTKQLPAAKWIEFINRVDEGIQVYLLGASADSEACEYIIQQITHPNVINLAGKLSLLASAALMKDSVMNYVNDSAPMHLASAMNAPVCAVYCSTVPEFGFGPLSEQSHIVETTEELTCRPCGLHGHKACPQSHFNCAKSIDIDRLLELLPV